ncbi:hypothetical protein FBUS_00182 [Fasciolopsis buskii]|uniref:Uncharacterized protein n=1 Tax=Fasciolopsis buskii TaxID=27845 RepID=A0A8E0VE99_9TREM|nr:hypothetical protein FBUS_00182 [Fasciolopsis buski]
MPSKCTRIVICITSVLSIAFGCVALGSTNKVTDANDDLEKTYVAFNFIGMFLMVPVFILALTSYVYCRGKVTCPGVMIACATLSTISYIIALAVFSSITPAVSSRTKLAVEAWLFAALMGSFSSLLSSTELLVSH